MSIGLSRYQRQLTLPEFSQEEQQKLTKAKVLIVGCGGLGHPVASYLAGAGIGMIGLMDHDKVELSNLHRQIQFSESDIGKQKVAVLADRLERLNSTVNIETYCKKLNESNVAEIFKTYDIVLDCTDNIPTRYLINDYCVRMDKIMIYGSIFRNEGQVSIFNYKGGGNYRDLYPNPPSSNSIPNCNEGGVLGSLVGIIGAIQANEAIKLICGFDGLLINKLLLFDSSTYNTRIVKFGNRKNDANRNNRLSKNSHKKKGKMVKEISVSELKDMMDANEDFQLIDVRESHEIAICSLKGEHIPLGQIPENEDKIESKKKVVVHCRSGARSAQAVSYLQNKLEHNEMYNLKGGILAWADEIDPTMEKY